MGKRIFISSVQKEFAAERAFLKRYIENNPILSRFFSVFVFESDVPATNQTTSEVYLDELSRTDIYICLIGNDYGFADAEGISPTEREFFEATRLNLQRLVFVKGNDDSRRADREKAFLSKISPEITRRRFNTQEELLNEVYASLDWILASSQAYRLLPFDASPCERATLADIDPRKISWFARQAAQERGWKISADASAEEILTRLHLLPDGVLTNAAILLFGKEPQDFFLSSEIKCLHYHGLVPQKPIPSYQIYRGTVFDLIDQAVDFVLAKISRAVGVRIQHNQADVQYELPPEIVREAIVNAVAHRDYTSTASVQVMLFADRLEIFSPGTLNPALTIKQLSEIHGSYPVNPLIADSLFLTHYVEKAGTGTSDIVQTCTALGLQTPKFVVERNYFQAILYRPPKKKNDGINSLQPADTKEVTKTAVRGGKRCTVRKNDGINSLQPADTKEVTKTAVRGGKRRTVRKNDGINSLQPADTKEVTKTAVRGGKRCTVRKNDGINSLQPADTKELTKTAVIEKMQMKICRWLRKHSENSAAELAQALKISPRRVERHLSELKAQGKIRHIGPNKGGHWEVVGR